jgi:RNA polymerase subunit RPABC4/transcription elongation factor Spt4
MKTNNPEAYISIGKNRLKVYESNNVYLENNQEFSFEFFNPTSDNLMVRIHINGKTISDKGVVLRPGMRGWLDRYLDENRKFLFQTYTVGTSAAVQKAIEDNGAIKIEFFREKQRPAPKLDLSYTTGTTKRGRNFADYGNDELCRGVCDSLEDTMDFMGSAPNYKLSRRLVKSASQETGRVEKGGASNQYFNMVDMEFEYLPFHTVEYKMLPMSQKKIEIGKLHLKCEACGAKLKQGWKVCPVCAHPINEKGICEHCGAEVQPAWKVCPMCGNPLK